LSYALSLAFVDPGLVGSLMQKSGLGWVDGVYWTLWIEVRFYLMAAVLFALFRRRFLTALTIVMAVSFIAGLRDLDYPIRPLLWVVLLPTFLPYFVFGAAIRALRAPERQGLETCVALWLSAGIIMAQGWLSFEYPAGGPLGFALINGVIISVFLLFAFQDSRLGALAWPPLAKLGEASYSLYLIHSVFGLVLIGLLSRVAPWPLALGLVTLGVVVLAFALHRWVEIPGKRLILQLTAPAGAGRPRPFARGQAWIRLRRRAASRLSPS
jgi:peptidoglycan/LPS O-acetylase OafA/YrhL